MDYRSLLGAVLLCLTASLEAGAQAPTPTAPSEAKNVTVSYYSTRYDGRRTANKEVFSSKAMTAAHREYPFGTRLRLANPANGKSVVVRVNDRGPFVKGRDVSVTRRAAQELGFVRAGTAKLTMEVMPSVKN